MMIGNRKTNLARAARAGWILTPILLVAWALPATTALAQAAEKGADGPVAYVDSTAHDFGVHWIGPDVSHTFKISNKGNKTLNILKVRPACGCTVAGKHPVKIEPGETGDFPFSVNSRKVAGKYEKSITVKTDDPANSSIVLKLKGECKRYVDVFPVSANFGRVFGNEDHRRVMKVTNNTEEPLSVELVPEPDQKDFNFELVEVEPGKRYEVHVTIPDILKKSGRLRSSATLKTNKNAQESIQVTASATVPKRLDISPAIVNMTTAARTVGDRPGTRVVRFTNYGDTPAKILEATVDDPQVKVTVEEQTAGKRYAVNMEMPAGWQPQSDDTKLVLKTDDKEFPTIEVPIIGSGKKSPDPRPNTTTLRPSEQLIGQQAKPFTLTTVDGKPVGGDAFQGKITILDFWAPNCGFCKKQIPRLEALRQEYEPKGVRFVAVAQTMRKKYEVEELMDIYKGLNFNGELALDLDNTVGPLFGATGFPTMSIVGKKGVIEAVNVGNKADLEQLVKTQLDLMLAGKPVPKPEGSPVEKKDQRRSKRPAEELVGQPVPTFSATTTDGKPVSNETTKNQITVLDFWAPNCGFCKKQIPRLEPLREKYEAKGVRFVALAQTMRKEYPEQEVQDIYKGLGFHGELVLDPKNTVGHAFKATSFPTMSIVGKSGKVEAVNVGNKADLEKRVSDQLDALLAGKPVPTFDDPAPRPRQQQQRPAMEMVGKQSPDFTLNTIEGKPVSNAEFAKHPATILNFVAPNCGFCKKLLPNVEKIRPEYEAKGVRFINMCQTMRKQYTPEEALDVFKGTGAQFEFAYDDGNKIGKMFKATSFPTMVVINREGKVEHVNIGAKPDIENVLKGQLDALIGGKSTMTTTTGAVKLDIQPKGE